MVLLYGRDSLMMMGEMLKLLEVFYHRAARKIVGMMVWRAKGG